MPVDPDMVPWETIDQDLPTGKAGLSPAEREKEVIFFP
jgi:hypothetical protein